MSQCGNKRKKGVGTALLATSLAGSAMGAATSGSVSAMLGNNFNNNKEEDYIQQKIYHFLFSKTFIKEKRKNRKTIR